MKPTTAKYARGLNAHAPSLPQSEGNMLYLNQPNVPKVERGIPMPEGKWVSQSKLGILRATLRAMKQGDSFVWSSYYASLYQAAHQVKIKITVRKLNGEGYRVWRVK